MANETNQAIIRRWWDALNRGVALDIIDEIYATDYILHDPTQPEPVLGTAGVHEFISAVSAGFPHAQYTLEDVITEGEKVVQRLTVRGTHHGEFMGIPASGNTVVVWIMVISRIANNKIAEEWQLVDSLSLMQQLGAIPS